MSNQVKQLELNFGMLTVAQQETVDRFVSNSKRNADNASAKTARIEALLISGGFKAGIDYVNNLDTETVTEDREFGYDNEFSAEVTYVSSYGGCQLITEYYDSSKNIMSARLVSVGIEHDKLECSTVTSQYRAYKPTSLLTKLQEYNVSQLYKFDAANKEKMVLNHTIDKYKKLFPNATVEEGTDYYKDRKYNYTEFPIVYVKFDSGSYVSFQLGSEIDKEYTHKKFDAIASQMNTMELLNMFNNQ
jgi:hypothetical protein